MIKPHILRVVLAGQVVTIAVLVANTRLWVFILKPITYTFVMNTGFHLNCGSTSTTTSLTLRSSLASGKERICITLPDTVYLAKANQPQSAVDISLTSPTLSLEVSQNTQESQSYKSVKEEIQPGRMRTTRQILNIDQALQGDYKGIEIHEGPMFTEGEIEEWEQRHNLDEIFLPSWYNMDFLEAYSGKG